MKKLTKLHRKILRILKKLNQREYLHHFGPKKYNFCDHVTALLMMQVCKMSLRRIENFLISIEIRTPTYSALCKSRKKIPISLWNFLLNQTANFESFSVAVDSTGFSRANPSHHYLKRIDRKKPIKSYAKTSALFDINKKKFIALKARVKPRHDIKDVSYLIKNKKINLLIGDSSYDAEWLFEKCFNRKINVIVKVKSNSERGFYRRKMLKNYSNEIYHQRSLIESGWSSVKRKYGGNVSGKCWRSINAEIYSKTICHNLNLIEN
jgi:transposase